MQYFARQRKNPFTINVRDKRYRRAAERIENVLARACRGESTRLAQLMAAEERINRKRMLEVFNLVMNAGATK